MERAEDNRHSRARMAETAKDASRHAAPMRVSIREAVQISSHRYGRDALLRDPAWHASKVVFGFALLSGTADMAFVRIYERATPDRAGARPTSANLMRGARCVSGFCPGGTG